MTTRWCIYTPTSPRCRYQSIISFIVDICFVVNRIVCWGYSFLPAINQVNKWKGELLMITEIKKIKQSFCSTQGNSPFFTLHVSSLSSWKKCPHIPALLHPHSFFNHSNCFLFLSLHGNSPCQGHPSALITTSNRHSPSLFYVASLE